MKKVTFSRTLQEICFLVSEVTTSYLRQNSSSTCLNTSLPLPCLNDRAFIYTNSDTVSCNQWKSSWTCVWTRKALKISCHQTQEASYSFKLQSVIMEWKGQKAQGFPYLVYLPWLPRMTIPRTSQLCSKCLIKSEFSSKYWLLPAPGYQLSWAIGVARVTHEKLRRRLRKRIRRMKQAEEGTEWNASCSKNLGHLGVCTVLPIEEIASRKLPRISWW